MSYCIKYVGKKPVKRGKGINFNKKKDAIAFKKAVFNNSKVFKIVKK
jgi:hypothetical protein